VKKLLIRKNKISIFTIGFTQKSAAVFFNLLIENSVKTVIDVRLNNVSQLAGFTKKKDLEYFLQVIGDIKYKHELNLAPTADILTEYKKYNGDWNVYEKEFLNLIKDRQIEKEFSPELVDNSCLLCSEASPIHCHRRLVVEYWQQKWGNINIVHL